MPTLRLGDANLAPHLRLAPGDGFDPYDQDWLEPGFTDSPFAERQPLASVDVKNREMAFPMVISPFKPAARASYTNLVVNPSAEVDTTGWATSGYFTNAAVLTRDTGAGNFFTGSAGFKVVGDGLATLQGFETSPALDSATSRSSFALQAGTTYTFEVYIKSSSGTTALQLVLGAADASADIATQNITITTSWAKYAVSWTPTKDTANVRAVIRVPAAAAATYFFDAAIITASPSGVGYFDGSTEGCSWTGTPHASTSVSPTSSSG